MTLQDRVHSQRARRTLKISRNFTDSRQRSQTVKNSSNSIRFILVDMAAADVQIPPSNRVVPGSQLLPTAPFPSSIPDYSISPESVTSDWITSFNRFLSRHDGSATDLFVPESYWRDLLCMTWDFRTLQGPQNITSFARSSAEDSRIINVGLEKSASHKVPQLSPFGDLKVVQACLKIETSSGRGQGLVRLLPDNHDGGRWKALTLFTTLNELKGHEEVVCNRRPTGLTHSREDGGQNWKDRLLAQQNFEGDREPTVFVLGRPSEPIFLEQPVKGG